MAERSLLVRIGAELSSLEKALDKGAKSIAKVGKSMESLGKDMTAAITLPLVGVGGIAVAASESIQGALNKIRTGTGATGADLEGLGTIFRNVFKEVPQSADQVATAIADLKTRSGLAGPALQEMSKQMLDLARISGTEVGPLIQSTTQAFNNWGVATEEQSRALDFLFKVSQSTGIGVKELSDGLAKGGATFRALGVPIEEAATLLGTFSKNGIPAEAALSGLNQAAGKLAASGEPMAAGFAKLVDQIRSAPSATSAAGIAVAAFGESGTRMADAIRSGTTNVKALTDELRASPETIKRAAEETLTLSDRMQKLKNSLMLALEPLGKAIVDAMVRMIPHIESGIKSVAKLVDSFAALPAGTQATVIGIAALAASIGPALVAFGAFVQAVGSIMTGTIALKAAVAAAMPAIGGAIAAVSSTFMAAAAGIAGVVPAIVSGAMSMGSAMVGAGAAATGLAAGPLVALVAALGVVAYNWTSIKGAILSAASAISSGLASMWSATGVASTAAWQKIVSIAQAGAAMATSVASSLGRGLASVGAMLGNGFWDTIYSTYQKVFGYSDETVKGLNDGVQKSVDNAGKALDGLVQEAAQKANQVVSTAAGIGPQIAAMGSGGGGGGGGSVFGGISEVSGPSVGANVDAARPWNQSGTREFINTSAPPATQGPSRDWMNASRPAAPSMPSQPRMRAPAPSSGSDGFQGYFAPRIPMMAEGGIVNGATLAMIGEAGPEAVIPLDKMRGMMSGGGVVVNLFVSGSVATERGIAENIRKQLTRTADRNGTSLGGRA